MARFILFSLVLWHLIGVTHLHCEHGSDEKHTPACLHHLNFSFYKKDILFADSKIDQVLKFGNDQISYLLADNVVDIVISNSLYFLSEIITRGPPSL